MKKLGLNPWLRAMMLVIASTSLTHCGTQQEEAEVNEQGVQQPDSPKEWVTVREPISADKAVCPYITSEEYEAMFKFKNNLNDSIPQWGQEGLEDRSWKVNYNKGLPIGRTEVVALAYAETDDNQTTYNFYLEYSQNNVTISKVDAQNIDYYTYTQCKNFILTQVPKLYKERPSPKTELEKQTQGYQIDLESDEFKALIDEFGISSFWQGTLKTRQNFILGAYRGNQLLIIGVLFDGSIDPFFGKDGIIVLEAGAPHKIRNIEMDTKGNIYIIATHDDLKQTHALITRLDHNSEIDISFGQGGKVKLSLSDKNKWKDTPNLSMSHFMSYFKKYDIELYDKDNK